MTHIAGRPSDLLVLDDADPTGDLVLVLHTNEAGRLTRHRGEYLLKC